MTPQIITEMTTNEMVAEYNKLTGKSIKKFSDRKAGERQLAAARSMADTKKLLGGKPTTPAPEAKKETVATPKAAAKKPQPRVNIDSRSTAIANSWQDKKIAAKRAERSNVSVAGHGQFRSVKEAFEKIGLPLSKHIKFRMHLKAEQTATFEDEGKKFKFTIIEQQSIA